jgi:predicted acetyltransferase
MSEMHLVWPSQEYLPDYISALERGWSPDNMRGRAAAEEELLRIAVDTDAFLRSLVDKDATGDPITLTDGTKVPRLPGYRRWLWDGEFCGAIGLRWQRGTEKLPIYCLGHIGYAVVPWKQRRGYATRAVHGILQEARAEGLRYVEITTAPDNIPSQRVIEKNDGVFVEEFLKPLSLGGGREFRYRVNLYEDGSQVPGRLSGGFRTGSLWNSLIRAKGCWPPSYG